MCRVNPPLSAKFLASAIYLARSISMVAPSAPRDDRLKTPPGPEGSNGIDRFGCRGQPAGLPPSNFSSSPSLAKLFRLRIALPGLPWPGVRVGARLRLANADAHPLATHRLKTPPVATLGRRGLAATPPEASCLGRSTTRDLPRRSQARRFARKAATVDRFGCRGQSWCRHSLRAIRRRACRRAFRPAWPAR